MLILAKSRVNSRGQDRERTNCLELAPSQCEREAGIRQDLDSQKYCLIQMIQVSSRGWSWALVPFWRLLIWNLKWELRAGSLGHMLSTQPAYGPQVG